MIILGIETSCDETAAAVVQKHKDRITILSNIVASSASLQEKFGGIIPEQAAREQIKSIIPVIEEALEQAFPGKRLPRPFGTRNDELGIDAIAVTYGPGLIGSLLVGVETAKTLAKVWDKPLIPINHLLGHFYANLIQEDVSSIKYHVSSIENKKIHNTKYKIQNTPQFPCLGLLVSGGHTDLVLFTDHGKYKYLGGTRDDAAGECFDKCARLLGLPYPGGPEISKLAAKGDHSKFKLPIPMTGSKDFDFSYSGLKTAVANMINYKRLTINDKQDLAASIEETIVISLIEKIIKAVKKYNIDQIMIAGGVAANQKLVSRLKTISHKLKTILHVPPPNLCTDNGAMIASAGFFTNPIQNPFILQADPNLSLTND